MADQDTEAVAVRNEQIPALAGVLTRAFMRDPMCSYLFPDPGARARKMQWFFERELRAAAARNGVYTTPDLAGAAIWHSPDESTLRWLWGQARAGLWLMPFKLSPSELARGLRLLADSVAHMARNIRGPHWVLDTLGVAPERQGQGVSGILIRPVLRQADAAGIPCYVITNKVANISVYERFGFQVADRYLLRHTDLLMCGLRRLPSAEASQALRGAQPDEERAGTGW